MIAVASAPLVLHPQDVLGWPAEDVRIAVRVGRPEGEKGKRRPAGSIAGVPREEAIGSAVRDQVGAEDASRRQDDLPGRTPLLSTVEQDHAPAEGGDGITAIAGSQGADPPACVVDEEQAHLAAVARATSHQGERHDRGLALLAGHGDQCPVAGPPRGWRWPSRSRGRRLRRPGEEEARRPGPGRGPASSASGESCPPATPAPG